MKNALSQLMITALLLGIPAGCGKQDRTDSTVTRSAIGGSSSGTATAEPQGRLFLDEGATQAIRAFGADQGQEFDAWVFRWENSEVEGWVELEHDAGPEQILLDVRKDMFAGVGRPSIGGRVCGMLVVTLRKKQTEKSEAVFDVQVDQERECEGGDESSSALVRAVGKVQMSEKEQRCWIRDGRLVQMQGALGKKGGVWLELRLKHSEKPKTSAEAP